MSYPGRPQMVPGMPVPPPGMPPMHQFMGMGAPPPMMSSMMPSHMIGPPMPSMPNNPAAMRAAYRGATTSAPPTVGRAPVYSKRVSEQGSGPAVTVFVGNITERAPDAMIRHVLAACGNVVSWKRVQGASGRAPAFGFCEYGSPDSGLRAVRLLHDLEIGGKNLVVKVDAKTKVILDEFKDERRRKLGTQKDAAGNASPLQDERPAPADEDSMDYMDDDMKNVDQSALDRIKSIMSDYEPDMKNYNPPGGDKERKMSKAQEKLLKLSHGGEGGPGGDSTPNFDDGEMEEGKRDLITREIGKFREIMKKQEEEKEAERRRKETKEKDRQRDKEPRSPGHRRNRDRTRSPASPVSRNQSRSPPPLPRGSRHASASPPPLPSSRSRPQPPSRSPSPESTYSNKLRSKGRDWRRSHSRSRERDEVPAKRSEREIQKEREMEEEAKDRKKHERKAREKEAVYQERLRNWEGRERRKAKEHGKEREKERRTTEEQAREARRLKEFLEDYDDERDDAKFYKGRELARRLAAREAEIESDARDRQREKEELEEIRSKVYSDKGCENPSAEFERIKQEREQQYKPKILVKVESKPGMNDILRPASPPPQNINTHSNSSMSGISVPPPPSLASPWRPPPEDNSTSALASPPAPPSFHTMPQPMEDDSQLSAVSQASMPAMDDEPSPLAPSSRGFSGWKSPPSQDSVPSLPPRSSPSLPVAAPLPGQGVSIPVGKKRKLEIREVFNTEDDEDGSLGSGGGRKRKPLVPLDYGDDKKKKEPESGSKASQEEKRKHIKSLIDKIPTDKEALFDFPIDWEAVDAILMERRIRPWINKKIIEYIGEPEPTLVDFICSKVLVGSPPQGILDDVQMVLDEEAEVFVVKMWRLLIYEIEAKKLGLVK